MNFIEEYFTITTSDSDRVQKDEIEHLLKNNDLTLNQFKDEMRNRGIVFDTQNKKKNGKKGLWMRILLKERKSELEQEEQEQ